MQRRDVPAVPLESVGDLIGIGGGVCLGVVPPFLTQEAEEFVGVVGDVANGAGGKKMRKRGRREVRRTRGEGPRRVGVATPIGSLVPNDRAASATFRDPWGWKARMEGDNVRCEGG